MTPHVFITVGNRRWCMCCDLFQKKRNFADFLPHKHCPNDVPYASKNRAAAHEMLDLPRPKAPE